MTLNLRISFGCSRSQKEAQKQSIMTSWRNVTYGTIYLRLNLYHTRRDTVRIASSVKATVPRYVGTTYGTGTVKLCTVK